MGLVTVDDAKRKETDNVSLSLMDIGSLYRAAWTTEVYIGPLMAYAYRNKFSHDTNVQIANFVTTVFVLIGP